MIIHQCDACGVTQQDRSMRTIGIPSHIMNPNKAGYVDNEWNAVSRRDETFHLCNGCINIVFGAAAKAFISKRSESNGETP